MTAGAYKIPSVRHYSKHFEYICALNVGGRQYYYSRFTAKDTEKVWDLSEFTQPVMKVPGFTPRCLASESGLLTPEPPCAQFGGYKLLCVLVCVLGGGHKTTSFLLLYF